MLTNAFRRMSLALPLLASLGLASLGLASLGLGCHGQIGTASSGSGGSNGNGSGGSSNNGSGGTVGGGGNNVDAGGVTVKPTSFTPALASPTCRKIKDLVVGMPCSDDEVNTVTTMGPAGLQQLIIKWETESTYQPLFQGKMVPFFRNLFQQVGFIATENFKPQLLENVEIQDREELEGADVVWEAVERENAELAGRGRVLVRPSGTEPLVRVMVEAPTEAECHEVCTRLVNLINEELR